MLVQKKGYILWCRINKLGVPNGVFRNTTLNVFSDENSPLKNP
jgi:hypothetical protein